MVDQEYKCANVLLLLFSDGKESTLVSSTNSRINLYNIKLSNQVSCMNSCLALRRDSADKNEKHLHHKKDDTSILIIVDDIFR